MKTCTFTLILSGVAELTPALADALYSATQGDIELNLRDGVAFVEFERAAATLREAITTAIREVEQATAGVRVVRVESEAANVIAKINAELLGEDVWAMPADQSVADSTLESRISEFVSSIKEQYVRNEKLTKEGVDYVAARYFPPVVALSRETRAE